tara:strand:+ start:1605 stop:2861 length:1257 start_codon:yes stop_codon:yes gene_type:complete
MKIIIYLISITSFVFSIEKLFVACEGHYYGGQGTVSIIENLEYVSEISELGNTVQSVTVHNNKLFVISNGAHQIHVFEIHENGQDWLATVNTNNSGPRNMLMHNNLAYFTNWNSMDIKIMDLDTFNIINSIPVNGLPEDIITDGQNIWISITMNSDWSNGTKVIKLNPDDLTITEYEVGYGPGDLVYHNGSIYISRTFYDENWNTEFGTSKIDENGNITIMNYGNGVACGGNLTKHNNIVYRSYDGGIAPLDEGLNIMSEQKIGDFNFENLYGVESIDNNIYFAITDYSNTHQVVVLDELGNELSTFDVGVIPTDFAIWNDTVLDNKLYLPSDFEITNVYPNPFNPTTGFNINVPEAGYLSIKIYDVSGKFIETLADDFYTPNNYYFNWDATKMSSGLYIINATLNQYSISHNITLVK